MTTGPARLILSAALAWCSVAGAPRPLLQAAAAPQAGATESIDLAQRLAAGSLRAVNREVVKLPDVPDGVQVKDRANEGVAWIAGTDFAQGTIEVKVLGRDVYQRSFVGIAFHRKDDSSYEAVYLRPFNFRATDPARHQHAVQYMAVPDYDWPRLRQESPEEFENPVDGSIDPAGWVPLRIVVNDQRIQVFVGGGPTPALEARKLAKFTRGMIGLWTGNNSDGAFANLRITPLK